VDLDHVVFKRQPQLGALGFLGTSRARTRRRGSRQSSQGRKKSTTTKIGNHDRLLELFRQPDDEMARKCPKFTAVACKLAKPGGTEGEFICGLRRRRRASLRCEFEVAIRDWAVVALQEDWTGWRFVGKLRATCWAGALDVLVNHLPVVEDLYEDSICGFPAH